MPFMDNVFVNHNPQPLKNILLSVGINYIGVENGSSNSGAT
jgi:hypothetical protein